MDISSVENGFVKEEKYFAQEEIKGKSKKKEKSLFHFLFFSPFPPAVGPRDPDPSNKTVLY